MSPTLIVDTKTRHTINQEEVFGPVVSVVKIKDYEEALGSANDAAISACRPASSPPA